MPAKLCFCLRENPVSDCEVVETVTLSLSITRKWYFSVSIIEKTLYPQVFNEKEVASTEKSFKNAMKLSYQSTLTRVSHAQNLALLITI